MSLDEWSCLVSTYVLNDLVEKFPETSDEVLACISDSLAVTVEHLWDKRPSDRDGESL